MENRIWQDRLDRYMSSGEEEKIKLLKQNNMSEKAYLAYLQKGINRQNTIIEEIRKYFKNK